MEARPPAGASAKGPAMFAREQAMYPFLTENLAAFIAFLRLKAAASQFSEA